MAILEDELRAVIHEQESTVFFQINGQRVEFERTIRQADYIVLDRQHLDYLNFSEKLHCSCYAYGARMIAYIGEIVARTEQYFCPLKHTRKILGTHSRYASFLDYGDAADFPAKLKEFRIALAGKK